jgi:hypothetical protein
MALVARPFVWFYHEFGVDSIANTGRNAYLIILSRALRMFAYGTNTLILGRWYSQGLPHGLPGGCNGYGGRRLTPSLQRCSSLS